MQAEREDRELVLLATRRVSANGISDADSAVIAFPTGATPILRKLAPSLETCRLIRWIGGTVACVASRFLRERWTELETRLWEEFAHYRRESRYRASCELVQFLIVGEDRRFLYHPGFDIIAIGRATWRRIAWGRQEGASTIEQQLVRVLTGRYERTLRRKLAEIFLATLVPRVVPKSEVPGLYLQVAYFGWRMNGLRQACQRLGLDPGAMSAEQAAGMVARLKYPQPRDSPPHRWAQIARRQAHLIHLRRRMTAQGTWQLVPSRVASGATI